MFPRSSATARVQRATWISCAVAGALGCLPGAAGVFDPVTELAWLALFAPAAGALCGAVGPGVLLPAAALPASWFLLLAVADARSARDLATPIWSTLALAGMFALGHALGRISARRETTGASPWTAGATLAGALFCVGLLLAGAAVGFGLGTSVLAREHPHLARLVFDASPLTLVFDCAGWDWAHAQPDVYARAGVEWFQRRPYVGSLAGPTVLVVGLVASWLLRAHGPVQDRGQDRAGAR